MAREIGASVHGDDNHHHEVISVADYEDPKWLTYYSNRISNTKVSLSSIPRVLKATIFGLAIVLGCFVLLSSFTSPSPIFLQPKVKSDKPQSLESILRRASMKDGYNKTVILTNLNDAWAEPNSIFDLFLESFRIGKDTAGLVSHLVVICMDDKAYARCSISHPHCYRLSTSDANFTSEAFFMSSNYVKMVGQKIEFLSEVLQMGYSFIFTDNDIMWLRNPFQRLSQDVDFQLSCDGFNGNSSDLQNYQNTGFMYVRSNLKTIKFYKFWNSSRDVYPGLHDQDVLNKIKFGPFINNIGLRVRFLDTTYFGGFCSPSRDINVVCTMHANCCVGLENKIGDLKLLIDDWKRYNSSQPWSVPKLCRVSFQRMREQYESKENR